jgi:adenosylcobinamide-GDP ribazoletransferase
MSILKACIIAFGTYSKFPVPYFEWKEKDMKYSICFFPFVGVLLGAAEWLWFWICVNYGMGSLFKAAGAVIINILVTGGIHIDGYMDTMDALHSYQPVEKKLEILKDAHIGAFAVIMLSVLLLAYIGALPGIDFNNVPLFASTFVFSRILSGLSVVLFKGAKKGGMLYAFSSSAQKKVVCISLVMELLFMAAGTIWIYKIKAVFVIVAMLIVFIYYRYKSYKEFGGITGDLAGWFLCLSEMVAVILCVFI